MQLDIHPPFKPVGGVGVQAQPLGASRQSQGREKRAFQENVPGLRGDGRSLPPHDAGHGHRPGLVGDDQGRFGQGAGRAVQQDDGFPRGGEANSDGAPQAVVVEGVQGLAQLQHHIIGDVHHRA